MPFNSIFYIYLHLAALTSEQQPVTITFTPTGNLVPSIRNLYVFREHEGVTQPDTDLEPWLSHPAAACLWYVLTCQYIKMDPLSQKGQTQSFNYK